MLDHQINEQLGLLQKELSRLKDVTDYIDGAKENSTRIVDELEEIQRNYGLYSQQLFNLHKEHLSSLIEKTELQVANGVSKLEATGNNIESIGKKNLVETEKLLVQYKGIIEATDRLTKSVDNVDFPVRLSKVDAGIEAMASTIALARSSIEKAVVDNQDLLLKRLEQQDSQIKSLKYILYFAFALILIASVSVILIVK